MTSEELTVFGAPRQDYRWALASFSVLTAIYLLTFAPFNSALSRWHHEWNIAVLLVTTSALGFFWMHDRRTARCGSPFPVLSVLALLLAVGFIVSGLLHGVALLGQPSVQPVNLSGGLVEHWRPENRNFLVRYLYFPIVLLVLVQLLRKLDLVNAMRVVTLIFLFSLMVMCYQKFFDMSFMTLHPSNMRAPGLATDASAFQMSVLLAVPVLVVAGIIDKAPGWRVVHVGCAGLAIAGLIWSAGRTGIVGLGVMLVLAPAVVGAVFRKWQPRIRLLLFASTIIVGLGMLVVLMWFPKLVSSFLARFASSEAGLRLMASWVGFIEAGAAGASPERWELWAVGWKLLLASLLAGWGPGGFYREYPNQYFLESHNVRPAPDSVVNHYLMIPIDFGLPILLIYLVLMFLPLVVGVLTLHRLQTTGPRLFVLMLLATQFMYLLGINTIPPAYFPDLIWLWALQLGLLLVIGERVGVAADWMTRGRPWNVTLGVAGGLVAVSAIAAYPVTFGSRGYQARLDGEGWPLRYERNCFGIETDGQSRWTWCGRNARVKLPLPEGEAKELVVTLSAHNPDLQKNPLTVRYGGLAGPTRVLTLANPPSAQIRIPLDATHVVEQSGADGKTAERFAVLSLDVSRTWVPKQWGVNADLRGLGVSVQLPVVEK